MKYPFALLFQANPIATPLSRDLLQSFFARPAEGVAPELIGCLLVNRQAEGELLWGVKRHHDLMVEESHKRQAAARKVLLAIKKSRKRETLTSARQVADAPLAESEVHSSYIFRTDTNAVLARGIQGFEAAKCRANELRKSHGLKWDEVKFKAERGNQSSGGVAGGSGGSTASTLQKHSG